MLKVMVIDIISEESILSYTQERKTKITTDVDLGNLHYQYK